VTIFVFLRITILRNNMIIVRYKPINVRRVRKTDQKKSLKPADLY
jgi:hypothetical protein